MNKISIILFGVLIFYRKYSLPVSNQTGLFQFFYFTWLHNNQVIAYAILAFIALFLLMKKPNRRHVFFFISFLTLILLFEYQKHIVQDLAEQTVDTIFIAEGNYKAQWFTKTLLYHGFPLIMWFIGWGFLALGLISSEQDRPISFLKKIFSSRSKKDQTRSHSKADAEG